MRPILLALLFVVSASPAAALDLPPLCQALHGLGDASRATGGQPMRIAVSASGCAPAAPGPTGQAFCAAVGSDPDTVPWELLRTCLNTLSAEPQVTTSADLVDVGARQRKRITHMAAKLGRGVRLDVAYAAGRYDIVVWTPK